MPRHAKIKSQTVHRSPSAARAHRAGAVTHTIDIARSPAFEVRQRANAAAARNGLVLGMVAAMVWVYDIARVIRH
jgi:hypothetical protein